MEFLEYNNTIGMENLFFTLIKTLDAILEWKSNIGNRFCKELQVLRVIQS